MKVIERVLEVDSTLEGEKIAMGIRQDALAHIMSVLTDLYSNPELAVIREYSTNAFDAHVEAGVTRPIEVTLPSPLSPYFKVRDYGFGLNADDIREIYSQYGASTKRDSDDVVGMLGLGCKSALTYCDQFILTGIKDGVATQVAISRDEDGSGSMTIVDQFETDDPSGVEVVVPAKTGNNFEELAKDFFKFWDEGTVLVNSEAPRRVDGIWIADDILLTNEVNSSYVVMGNVAYPFENDGRSWNEWPTVAFVEIGAVQFTPSREQLQMTKLTQATLDTIKKRRAAEKVPAYIRKINACATRAEALELALNANRIGIKDKLTYNGEDIPTQMSAPNGKRFIGVDAVKRYRRKGWDWNRVIPASSWPNTIWLTDYDGADFSAHKRKKIEAWAAEKGLSGQANYILLEKIPAECNEWIDQSKVYSWEEPKAIKIKVERSTTYSGRISGSYDAYTEDGFRSQLLAADIDQSKPIFYTVGKWLDPNAHKVISANHKKGYTIVLLGRNRIKKFQRDFPAAVEVFAEAKRLAEAWRDSLTDHDRLSLHLISVGDKDVLKKYDETRIDDPKLVDAILAAKRDTKKLQEKLSLFSRFVNLTPYTTWKNPLDRYVLLTDMRGYARIAGKFEDHIYTYLNAVHAAETQEEVNAV